MIIIAWCFDNDIDCCSSLVLQLQRARSPHACRHHGHAHIQVKLMIIIIMVIIIIMSQGHDDHDPHGHVLTFNDVTAVLPMWGRKTRMVQCLTQCSRWSSSSSSSLSTSCSSSSQSTLSPSSSSSLTCSVPLLGDNHNDVGGLRRHLPNHLVWKAHRRGTFILILN